VLALAAIRLKGAACNSRRRHRKRPGFQTRNTSQCRLIKRIEKPFGERNRKKSLVGLVNYQVHKKNSCKKTKFLSIFNGLDLKERFRLKPRFLYTRRRALSIPARRILKARLIIELRTSYSGFQNCPSAQSASRLGFIKTRVIDAAQDVFEPFIGA
jgi:hypothetical protein